MSCAIKHFNGILFHESVHYGKQCLLRTNFVKREKLSTIALKAKSHIALKMKLNIHMNVSVHTPLTATP